MSNVVNFSRGVEGPWKENPSLGCKMHGQELEFVSFTNPLGESLYIVNKKQKNGKFKRVCSFDDEILMMLLDAKNVKCSDCDDGN